MVRGGLVKDHTFPQFVSSKPFPNADTDFDTDADTGADAHADVLTNAVADADNHAQTFVVTASSIWSSSSLLSPCSSPL